MKRFGRAAITALSFVILAGVISLVPQRSASGNSPLSVNVTNTPLSVAGNVNATLSGTPVVNVNSLPAVNVNSLPPVSLAGTPTVNTNITFPANQAVTVAAAGPLTNVGRLPSQQVMLFSVGSLQCPTGWRQNIPGPPPTSPCFDLANYPGEILVITDFSWNAVGNPGVTCRAGIHPPNIDVDLYLLSTAVAAGDGFAGKSEHLTTGITLSVNPVVDTSAFQGFSGCNPQTSIITGYLLPNQ